MRPALTALALLSGCLVRVPLTSGPLAAPTARSSALEPTARCDTGSAVVELTGWRARVEAAFLALPGLAPDAVLEAATLRCRTVNLEARPVLSGARLPAVTTLQTTELELQVEVRWARRRAGACVLETWLGRSRWRVVPADEGSAGAAVAEEALAALAEALRDGGLYQERPAPCPSVL